MVKQATVLALLPLSLSLAGILGAATVETQSVCYLAHEPGVTVVNGGCSLTETVPNGLNVGIASASGTASLTIPADPGNYVQMQVRQVVDPEAIETRDASAIDAFAGNTLSFAAVMNTPGPERPGYLQVFGKGFYNDGNLAELGSGGDQLILTVPGYHFISCDSYNGCFLAAPTIVPVTLGTAFSLTYEGFIQVGSSFGIGGGVNTAAGTFDFRFLEEDGTTPVAVSDVTPEPATWGLLVTALPWAVYGFRRKRKIGETAAANSEQGG